MSAFFLYLTSELFSGWYPPLYLCPFNFPSDMFHPLRTLSLTMASLSRSFLSSFCKDSARVAPSNRYCMYGLPLDRTIPYLPPCLRYTPPVSPTNVHGRNPHDERSSHSVSNRFFSSTSLICSRIQHFLPFSSS